MDTLRAELPGILARAVRGCLRWQREGLHAPESVIAATAAYRAEEDTIGSFLPDRCVTEPEAHVLNPDLRAAYSEWCEANGERVLSAKALRAALLGRPGITDGRTAHGRGYRGLRLNEHDAMTDASVIAKTSPTRAREAKPGGLPSSRVIPSWVDSEGVIDLTPRAAA